MEIRQITQVKVYILVLNPMQDRNKAIHHQVAMATDKNKIIEWYNNEIAEEPYTDNERWHKLFKKGSVLEWYNPAQIESIGYSQEGIHEGWINFNDFEREKNNL